MQTAWDNVGSFLLNRRIFIALLLLLDGLEGYLGQVAHPIELIVFGLEGLQGG